MLGMRATESHDLVLNDVIVPFENFVETKHKPQPNGWILHIPSVYLGIAQAARDYAIEFAKTHSPNSIEGTIATLPTVQQNVGKMESLLLSARHFYGVQLEVTINIMKHLIFGMKHLQVKF